MTTATLDAPETTDASVAQPAPTTVGDAMRPLLLDVAVPVGGYLLLRYVLGASLLTALTLSSIPPAARTVVSAVRDRSVNGLAALILAVNLAGIALSFVTGNARIMLAKDSGVSSVVAVGTLVSLVKGSPLMAAGLKPFVTKADAARERAWDRLEATSDRFVALERRHSAIWGIALLVECIVRLVGAFTLPLSTLSWLGTSCLAGAIVAAIAISGAAAASPIEELVRAEAAH